ncbi:hypothetical protein GCM10010470_30610 [Saccharopolyspora taberi]|uniref:ATP-binding protein n=1 Tax=Saccharopolyspora taberi TaxID=60895 RepID=A0ABN3VD99_9PSEU
MEEVRIRCELAEFRAKQGVPIAAVAIAGANGTGKATGWRRPPYKPGGKSSAAASAGELGDDVVVLLRASE